MGSPGGAESLPCRNGASYLGHVDDFLSRDEPVPGKWAPEFLLDF